MFGGCDSIDTRTNVPQDIEEGRKVADQFYSFIKNRDFEKACSLTDNNISKEDAMNYIKKADSIAGFLKEISYKNGTSKKIIKNGKIQSYQIELHYEGQYEKQKTREKIIILWYDDKLIIDGYFVELLIYES